MQLQVVYLTDFLTIDSCKQKFCLKESTRAAIRYLGLGGFNNRVVFSHTSGGRKSQIKVLIESVSGGSALFGLQMVVFEVSSHDIFLLLILDQGPTLLPSSNLCHLFQIQLSKYSHAWVVMGDGEGGQGFNMCTLVGDTQLSPYQEYKPFSSF